MRGLKRAGFTGGWLGDVPMPEVERVIAQRQPEPEEVETQLVVVLGSSTAEGAGPEEEANTWVNRFRRALRVEGEGLDVLNLARGGYTTYHLLPTGSPAVEDRPPPDTLRNITAALARRPAAIIVNMPSNDAAYGYAADEQRRNFEAITAAAEEAGVPIWVTTTQPRDLDPAATAVQLELRDWILERYGERAVDFWTGFADDSDGQADRYDSGDGVHYNDDAHRIFFERIRDAGIFDALTEPVETP